MQKIKNGFGCFLVTVVIWAIARLIPSLISSLDPNSITLKALLLIIALPIGWLAASAISKDRYQRCIRVNLYLFAFIEATGILNSLFYLMQNLSFYTGRYYYDANGIAYSDYLTIFGGIILYEVIYIILCIYLTKKKPEQNQEESEPKTPDHIDENREEKQRLRNEISKWKAALKDHDEAYEKNRKILEEAFTDEELNQMVARGEFTEDQVAEYRNQRNSLAMFIESAPSIRKTALGMIRDREKQLADLESSKSDSHLRPNSDVGPDPSSGIRNAEYKDYSLYVTFGNGESYMYYGVSETVCAEVVQNPSNIKYFMDAIDGRYPFLRV